MVMTLPDAEKNTPLFRWLKPCTPAAGVAAGDLRMPTRLGKWQRRILALSFASLQVAAVALGAWLPSRWQQTEVVTPQPASEARDLWNALGSTELADALLSAKLQQAERERLQAQQLRIDAEEQAQTLVEGAAAQARQTTYEALRRAELIKLDATFIGAEQVIYAENGDLVTLKFAASVQCKAGEFGMSATATPIDKRIATREVRNLGNCFPSTYTAAGEAVGEVGEYGVAFFKLDGR